MATNDQRDDRPPPINLDEDVWNADWAKRTWDLDIEDVTELRQFIDSIGMTVEDFKKLPVYVWHKDKPGFEWLKDL